MAIRNFIDSGMELMSTATYVCRVIRQELLSIRHLHGKPQNHIGIG